VAVLWLLIPYLLLGFTEISTVSTPSSRRSVFASIATMVDTFPAGILTRRCSLV